MTSAWKSSLSEHRAWLIVCVPLALWLAFAVNFIVRTSHVSIDGVRYYVVFDDGMIGMRYAKNLVLHHALVWNLGERVEGFTDPLWTLLMAAAIWVFGTHFAPLAMQVLGGLICLALFIYFFRFATRTNAGFAGAFLAFLFLLLAYPISYWGLGGMEACALCLIYALAAGAQYRYENCERPNPLLLHSGLIVVAYLLRPDGWLALAPFFAASAYDCLKQKNYRRVLVAMMVPVVVAATTLVARKLYYGEWVPNTYVLKVEGYSLGLRLQNGMAFLTPFFQQNLAALGLVVLSVFTKKRAAYLNMLAVDILLAYQVYVGGDVWQYWRQILPVFVATSFAIVILFDYLNASKQRDEMTAVKPPAPVSAMAMLAVFIPAAIGELVFFRGDRLVSGDRRPFAVAYFVAAAVLFWMIGKNRSASSRPGRNTLAQFAMLALVIVTGYSVALCDIAFVLDFGHHKPYIFDSQADMINKAVLANRLFGPGRTHHVVWAGTYSYYVDGTVIDSLGKSDKAIARYPVDRNVSWDGMTGVPGHAKYNFRESILERRPDIVVDRAAWFSQDVSPEMKGSYVLVKSQDVSLCVKKELTVGIESLVQGSCPAAFFYARHSRN